MDQNREQAIEALREFGFVFRDEARPDKPVIEVDLGGAGVMATDDIVKHLRDLPESQNLFLEHTSVTDKVLGVLRLLPALKKLRIRDTQITDDGLDRLADSPDIETLVLGDKITDVGLRKVSVLKKLKYLDISKTSATGDGLETITALEDLEFLALSRKQLTSRSIAFMAALPKLQIIRLFNVDSSDPLFVQLKSLVRSDVVIEEF